MKHLMLVAAASLALAAGPLHAHDMQSMTLAQAAKVHLGRGVVNRVDAAKSTLNITHDAIPSLDWPGMTMDFPVADKALLAKIRPGQKIQFELSEVAPERYQITRIREVK